MPKPETIAWLRQSAALDGSATSQTLLEVLERLERLEAAKSTSGSIDDQQTLHSIALKMVNTLERQGNVLPEILDTIRRAIKEPSPCPHIRSSDEGTSYCALAEPNDTKDAPTSSASYDDLYNLLDVFRTGNTALMLGEMDELIDRYALPVIVERLQRRGCTAISDQLEAELS